MKGILVIKGHGWSNAKGHVTLWDGNKCQTPVILYTTRKTAPSFQKQLLCGCCHETIGHDNKRIADLTQPAGIHKKQPD